MWPFDFCILLLKKKREEEKKVSIDYISLELFIQQRGQMNFLILHFILGPYV